MPIGVIENKWDTFLNPRNSARFCSRWWHFTSTSGKHSRPATSCQPCSGIYGYDSRKAVTVRISSLNAARFFWVLVGRLLFPMRFLRRSYRHVRASRQPSDPRETVESSIETQNSIDPLDLHYGEVYCVSRREAFLTQHDPPGSLDCRLIDRKYFIDDSQQSVERRLNRIRPLNRHIAVKYFLQHFRVGHQPFSTVYQFFQPTPGIGFMRMGGAHQIHGNVGVDKDHGCTPDP